MPVSAVLLLLLVVDVGQVVGAGQEEGVVEGVVPVLGRGDQVLYQGISRLKLVSFAAKFLAS